VRGNGCGVRLACARIGILVFGETRLAGERLYASERLLRSMLGPAYEIAEQRSRGR
jgi:hypothetical protein